VGEGVRVDIKKIYEQACIDISKAGGEVNGITFCSNGDHVALSLTDDLVIRVGRGRGGITRINRSGRQRWGGGVGRRWKRMGGAATTEASGDLVFFVGEEKVKRRAQRRN
jgi:hypothetical protein